jgi:hypothetical protein
MATAPHVITQQRLHLRLGPAADGPALHRRAEHTLLGPPLLAALDAALGQALAGAGLAPGAWLTLDRLVLDLGSLSSDDFETHLLERLPGLLRRLVAEAVSTAVPLVSPATEARSVTGLDGPSSTAFAPTATTLSGVAVGGTGQAEAAGRRAAGGSAPAGGDAEFALPAVPAVHQVSAPMAAGAAWLFFLHHGALPAHWPPPASAAVWEASLLVLLAGPPPALLAGLRAALTAPAVRLRLLRQFSPALAAAVLGALAPTAVPYRARLARLLARLRPAVQTPGPLTAGSGDAAVAGEAVGLALLARVAGAATPPDWVALLAAVPAQGVPLAHRAAYFGNLARALAQGAAVLPHPEQPPGTGPQAESHPTLQPASQAALQPMFPAVPFTALVAGVRPGDAAAGATAIPAPPQHRLANAPAPLADAAEYVTNAGVVLLHPFLPQCFAACGWLDADNQFFSPDAQAQAVLLVHFLATGRGQAPEYELRLPRLLCGVLPGVASPRRLVLGRAPRAEGRALLRAALAHWAALRNTTSTALRTAFLQREGKLEASGPGGPVLTVAQQAQDVLLSRLPYGWGVGLVQLPWLSERLSVSWA